MANGSIIVADGFSGQSIQMTNSWWARTPVAGIFAGTWKVRLALHLSFHDFAANVAAPYLSLGVCSGTSAIPGDGGTPGTPTNFVGLNFLNSFGAWTRNGSTGYTYASSPFGALWKHGSTAYNAANFNGGLGAYFGYSDGAGPSRKCLFVDIEKASPNYILTVPAYPSANVFADISTADFLAQSIVPTPVLSQHSAATTAGGASTVVGVTESAGTFDSICCYWNSTIAPLLIHNIRVIKFA